MSATLPRLLETMSLPPAERRAAYGELPSTKTLPPAALIGMVEAAGLRGCGGAAFSTAAKLQAVRAAGEDAIMVANGCESEPLSGKDKLLLAELPHLVLDGAVLAARTVGARRIIVAYEEADAVSRESLETALEERDEPFRFELFAAANCFLSGQETALVSQINGGAAKPTLAPPRPSTRGVGRRPTMISNVETLAHLALIARHGSAWYRQLGDEHEPGSKLVTLDGAVENPGVYEIEWGTALSDLLDAAGGPTDTLGAVLLGGYFGSWLGAGQIEAVELSSAALRQRQAALGCGAIFLLPAAACVVAETVAVAAYLATETAQQCGPCIHGTAAISRTLSEIAEGESAPSAFDDLRRWCGLLPGRGACHHPNGLVHFVETALTVFADRFAEHARHGPCEACGRARVLPIPALALA